MRDPKRIAQILNEISRIWNKCPDMRFGQLTDSLYSIFCKDMGIMHSKDCFYIEDDEFLKWLQTYGL